jgi:hypothetical protein
MASHQGQGNAVFEHGHEHVIRKLRGEYVSLEQRLAGQTDDF